MGDKNTLVNYLIEVIHSKEYLPEEKIREDLAIQILRYIDCWLDESNSDLCENITTFSANLDISEALHFLQKKLKTTKNKKIIKDISGAINEINDHISGRLR